MSKLISVVVPCYQVKDYVEHCVGSILNQKFTDYEIILVDDGSTDGTSEICDNLSKNNECIRVVHKENGGLSDARNVGIENAEGQYICFIDSDDYIHPEYLSCLYETMCKTESDVVVCAYETTTELNCPFDELENKEITTMSGDDAVRELILSDKIMNYAWNKLYKKELFDEVRYPLGKKWEDIGATYKIFLISQKVTYVPQVLYYYVQRQGSITSSENINNVLDQYDLLNTRLEDLKSGFPELVDRLQSQLCDCCYNCWSFLQTNKKPLSSCQNEKVEICLDYLNNNGREILLKWAWDKDSETKVRLYFKCRFALKMMINFKRLLSKWR